MAGRGTSRGSRGGHADRTGPASSKGASRSANLGARSRGGRGTMGGFDPSAAPVGIGKNTGKGKSKGTSPLGGPGGKGTTSGKKGMRKSTWDNMSAGEKMKGYGTTSYTKYKANLGGKSSSSGGGSRSDR